MTRVVRTGRDSWTARTGYQHMSPQHAKFVRPAGEPPLWLGVIVTAAGLGTIIAGVLLVAALHHSSRQSSTTPLVAAPATSAVEAGGVAERSES